MSLPQQIVRSFGATIDFYPKDPVDHGAGAGVVPQVTVRGPDGAVYVNAATATLDPVDTTLSSSASIGATTIAVTSATSVIRGRKYLLGTAASELQEMVRIRNISGTTLTVFRPLVYAHASGAEFMGTRLSFAVTSAQATTLFWDGSAEWNWTADGSAARDRRTRTAVECVLQPLERLATANDMQIRDPKFYRKIDSESDVDELLDTAFEDVISQVSPQTHARTIQGSDGFILPTVYRALWLAACQFGEPFAYLRDIYNTEWERSIALLKANFPADNDQDGFVESHERAFSSVRFERA